MSAEFSKTASKIEEVALGKRAFPSRQYRDEIPVER